ncbi:MAG: hypothetical protein Q8N84_01160 [bacterium]|nr:hypothetical protein [bacterium]
MIYLTNRKGEDTENPTITDIQKAFNDLLISKDTKNVGENHISLVNDSELALEIYQATVVLQDYGCGYDGPGGPGELLRVRYKEGSLFYKIDEAVRLLENEEREKLIKLLKSLPKSE